MVTTAGSVVKIFLCILCGKETLYASDFANLCALCVKSFREESPSICVWDAQAWSISSAVAGELVKPVPEAPLPLSVEVKAAQVGLAR